MVCFGMLKDIIIQFNHGRSIQSIPLDQMGKGSDMLAFLDLQICGDRCDILSKGNMIATMNSKTHHALNSLSQAVSLRYTGILCQEQVRPASIVAAGAPLRDSKPSCAICLLLYGPESIGDNLAKELAKYRLFLQHPIFIPVNVMYKNPQYLTTIQFSFTNGAILPPIQKEDSSPKINLAINPDCIDSTYLLDIVDHLPVPQQMKEADIDQRIKTTLLSHQKEAVEFVLRRESNAYPKQNSLWKQERVPSDDTTYKHIVTGEISNRPEDMLGGILADGMGLGKTLTMLACVVASLENAKTFERNEFTDQETAGQISIPARSTLIVLPSLLLLESWIDELEKHVISGTISYYKYHGPDRKLPSSSPPRYHIIFSTYGTIAADSSRGGGVLKNFHWYRLILDEAHIIRNTSTKQFKAVASLSASIRWCITGTPIQNSLGDLGSLIEFLRVPNLGKPAAFRKYIENSRKIVESASIPDYKNLKLLLGSICLRRCTSVVLQSLGVEFRTHRPEFSDIERRRYERLSIECREHIMRAVNGNIGGGGRGLLLKSMLLLRIFCNTGLRSGISSQSPKSREEELPPDELLSLLQQSNEDICVTCDSRLLPSDTEHAQQYFSRLLLQCRTCLLERSVTTAKEKGLANEVSLAKTAADDALQDAPTEIHAPLDSTADSKGAKYKSLIDGTFDVDTGLNITSDLTDILHYPSKILSLLTNIKEHYFEDKSIVFSFWRRSLDVVEQLFREQGFNFRRVDGDVLPSQRKGLIAEFQNDSSVRVLLMTIGTGAIGLNNLSVASRVHILEPQWNHSVEDQAIGRIVRLGQKKQVCVIRYIMRKTIEESIEHRQLQKLQLAMKGGLEISKQGLTEKEKRIAHLRALGEIIESTIGAQGT
ncbi:hypothetical protein F4777DRAFT_591102 [Nemania sp. FL0916]|nr:hypothetical protein F4777DRAFT_591102 [Nemania sp. FL0916]